MKVEDFQFIFDGMDYSDAIVDYTKTKFNKVEKFLQTATSGTVVFKQEVASRGVDKDFRVDVNVNVPRVSVHVEEYGSDVYAILDKIADVLARKLKRYNDKIAHWEGRKSWSDIEIDAVHEQEDNYTDVNTDYTPVVSVRKRVENMRPMFEAEAIEYMELHSFRQLLFKNVQSGKWAMLYKRDDGTYGIVEPKYDI
jgi:putative sigma-54 modulation protein